MRIFTIIFSLFLLFGNMSFAQTIIPGGNVSGTWTAAGTPYLVYGNITIEVDSTLAIEPGVEVNFQGTYSLTVNGILQAIGTATDSIHFTGSLGWLGITLSNAPDSSHMEYCVLDSANPTIAPLFIRQNSNPVISHCTIKNNQSSFNSGGIYLSDTSNARISYCTISNNAGYGSAAGGIKISSSSPEILFCSIIGNSGYQGGGIQVIGGCNPVISYSTISENSSSYGGGIYAGTGSSLTIRSSTIDHNDASLGGGGIFISSSNGIFTLTSCMILANQSINGNHLDTTGSGIHIVSADTVMITGSLFESNSSDDEVGAIYAGNCAQLIIDHCDFVKNQCWGAQQAGGITLNGSTNLTLVNSVFRNNITTHIDFSSYNSASVSYCDFYGTASGWTFSNPPLNGLGVLNTANANGDTCDVFYNIYLDPLFVDFANGNYNLTETSPCIDAGDPSSPLDPDGTICDMGAWYFHQSPLIFASDSLLDFGLVDIGQQMDLPLTIRNDGTVALRLQNVSNPNSVFTHDWNPADSLILPNDSLTIMVTFTPVDTNLIVDTLLIENNDKPLQVVLSGKGKAVVGIEDQSELPKVYALYPAYPNPFNPSTTISFDLPKTSKVTLKVFNILGEKVAVLVSRRLSAGSHSYKWDASNLASGIYLYRLQAGDYVEIRKMILMK